MKKKRRIGKTKSKPQSLAEMFGSHMISRRTWTIRYESKSQPWLPKTKKCKRNMKEF